MLNIKEINENDIEQVASFIAELNKIEEHHIGYCGTDKEEIKNYLYEEFDDLKAEECFVAAFNENRLIGVLGYEPDLDRGCGEIWGPFIKDYDWNEAASAMWDKLLSLFPNEINSVNIFLNVKNKNYMSFAEKLNFTNKKEYIILNYLKSNLDNLIHADLSEISEEYYDEFKSLHDEIFLNAYFNGEQILNRLDENKKMFIYSEDSNLKGYIYVEANPEFNEGSVHFIGVKKSDRGMGIGKKLLNKGLSWLLNFNCISELELCADAENENAIGLYKSVGFKLKHRLYYYSLKLN